ncbi:carboxy terminal-processing peptidase [Bdellovibrionales bacterium]|nr:carboxy terminal-processing peptidase [Bdellovibrionales bacterium]
MRSIHLLPLPLLIFALNFRHNLSAEPQVVLTPKATETFKKVMDINLQSNYNRDLTIDDDLSSKIFDNLLERFSADKSLFTQKQIETLEKHRYAFDESIVSRDPSLGAKLFNQYLAALEKRAFFVEKFASQVTTKSVEKALAADNEKDKKKKKFKDLTWPKESAEQEQRWTNSIYKTIALLSEQEYTLSEMKYELLDNKERVIKEIYSQSPLNSISLIANAILAQYDPHTAYLLPEESKEFTSAMKVSFHGIGARLVREKRYVQLKTILKGGPAHKIGAILDGSRIVEVKENPDSKPVNVVGWSTKQVRSIIIGPKGVPVWLSLLEPGQAADDAPKTFKLVRGKIESPESSASLSYIDSDYEGKKTKVAVIKIPSFYADFTAIVNNDPNAKSVAKDVRKILETVNREHIHYVIIDLRGNGGGSLSEVVKMVGFFILDGVTLYTQSSDEKITKYMDPDNGDLLYNGALSVLIDSGSASASEIFAGAIQDYERGWIFGSTSFGKGSVQTINNLGQEMGAIKYTHRQFFLPLGSSTQNRGVVPDVFFPDALADQFVKEKDLPNALSWSKLNAPSLWRKGHTSEVTPQLIEIEAERAQSNPDFAFIKEVAKLYDPEKFLDSDERLSKLYQLEMSRRKEKNEPTVSLKEFKKDTKTRWWFDPELEAKKDPHVIEAAYLLQHGTSLYW